MGQSFRGVQNSFGQKIWWTRGFWADTNFHAVACQLGLTIRTASWWDYIAWCRMIDPEVRACIMCREGSYKCQSLPYISLSLHCKVIPQLYHACYERIRNWFLDLCKIVMLRKCYEWEQKNGKYFMELANKTFHLIPRSNMGRSNCLRCISAAH